MTYTQSQAANSILPDDMFLMRTKKRVLVVDDDAMLRDLLCKMFASIGLKAVPAENGREAYELVQIGFFDLMVTDLQMPVMDGWTLIKKLRRHSRQLPVVVITGQRPEDIAQMRGEVPDCIFLYKPFTIKELTHAVLQALDLKPYAAAGNISNLRQRPMHSVARP
ncbi:MAG: response regulator [Desulfobacteraceae bacterium]|nr:MAG: response regulator [Desulfobacteraceae bacterium]